MLLNPALGGRGRQISLEFKASLVYIVSSKTAKAIKKNSISKENKTPKKERKKERKGKDKALLQKGL